MTRFVLALIMGGTLVLPACGAVAVDDWIVQPLQIEYRGVNGALAPQTIKYDVLCAPHETSAVKGSPLEGGDWVDTTANPVNLTPYPKFAAFEVTDGILVVEPICIGGDVRQPNTVRRPQFIKTAQDQRIATRLYRVTDNKADFVLPLNMQNTLTDAKDIHQAMVNASDADWRIQYGPPQSVAKKDRKRVVQNALKIIDYVDLNIDLNQALAPHYPAISDVGYLTVDHYSKRDSVAKMARKLRESTK